MILWSILGIISCIVLDQLSKYAALVYLKPVGEVTLIPNILDLKFVLNDGAAFSSFSGQRVFLLLFTGIALSALAVYLFWKKPQYQLERIGIILMLGGGLGNFIERAIHGEVVDFIAVTFVNFAIFNLADVFVCVGAAFMVFSAFLEEYRTKKKKHAENEKVLPDEKI